jgi:hypothetical protein
MMTVSPGSAAGAAMQAPGPSGAGDRELKFTLPGGRVELARRWLDAVCRRDPEFPAAFVWTIYYDTVDLASLGEKINSDYLKRKVRLRWYAELDGRPSGPVFLEAKLRTGTGRAKVRVVVPHAGDAVAGWDLADARLQALPVRLREHGILLRGRWEPVLLLRYRRDRFIEPHSDTRVSLDAEIAAVAVNRRVISTIDHSPLGPGILEVKGDADQLPAALSPLVRLGARKRAVSKYLMLYQHVAGSVC